MKVFSFLFLTLLFILGGCSNSKQKQQYETIQGVVQKGPFVDGIVEIYDIKTNELLQTTSIEINGTYSTKIPQKEGYYLRAKGHYFDEIKAKKSKNEIVLEAVALQGTKQANINLFTTFESQRVRYLIQQNKSFQEAKKQAFSELRRIFPIKKAPTSLNILHKENDDRTLLLFSAAFLAQSTHITPMSEDFAQDAKFDKSKTILQGIAKNLDSNFSSLTQAIQQSLGITDTFDKPNWIDGLVDISIKKIVLDGVVFNNTHTVTLLDENTIPLGIEETPVQLLFSVVYKKNISSSITPSITLQTPKQSYPLPTSIVKKEANLDGTYTLKLTATIAKNIKRVFELQAKENLAFVINIDENRAVLKNLPQFVTLDKTLYNDISITKMEVVGKCPQYPFNKYLKVHLQGTIKNTQATFNDICLQYDAAAFPHTIKIFSGEGSINKPVRFTHQSLATFILDIDTINKEGFHIKNLTITLPAGHSIHEKNSNLITPYGQERISIPLNNYFLSLDKLNKLSLQLPKNYYLHLPNTPLYFQFRNIGIKENRIIFPNTKAKYLFDYQPSHSLNNTNRFKSPSQTPLTLILQNNTFNSTAPLSFGAIENLQTSYPRATLDTGSFSIDINQSRMKIVQVDSDKKFRLDYISNCIENRCSEKIEKKRIDLDGFDKTKIFDDGASLSFFTKNLGKVEWGDNGNGTTFSRDKDRGAIVYIPGFVLPTTDEKEITNYLRGSVAMDTNTLRYYKLSSKEAKKGRYLFAGINVGKLIIDTPKQEDKGISLSGTKMAITLKDKEKIVLTNNQATKYYIRNSGITGVFNRIQLPITTKIYKYDTKFTRFAWRQVANVIDEYTWIDGAFHIPKRGDFDIDFESMRLHCHGSVDGAHVPPCHNGINCSSTLAAWSAKTDFTYLRFEGDSSCSDQRYMHIGHIVDMKALQHTLALDVTWLPAGVVHNSKLIGSAINRFDGNLAKRTTNDYNGFDIVMGENLQLRANNRQGWIEADVTVGLPVWDALQGSMRLQNATALKPAPTLVVERGDLKKFDYFKSNSEILPSIKKEYNATAHYRWGKLLDFTLPIYYSADEKLFRGREFKNLDLAFWKINSRIDYIKPQSTTIKYGMSANLNYFKKHKISIDLNDQSSLKAIDDVLVDDLKLFERNEKDEGPFEETFGQIHKKLRFANSLLSTTLDITLEELAYQGLREISSSLGKNDPFAFVSDMTTTIHTAPLLAKKEIEKHIQETIIQQIDKGFDELEKVFNNATKGFTYAAFAKQNDAQLQRILLILRQVQKGAQEYKKLSHLVVEVNSTINEANKIITKADELYKEIVGYFKPAEKGKTCSFDYTINHGVFQPVGKILKTVDDINKAIQSIPMKKIRSIANHIQNQLGLNMASFIASFHKLKKTAYMLNTTINDHKGFLQSNFNTYICKNKEIENTIQEITNRLKQIAELKNSLNTVFNNLNTTLGKNGELGRYIYGIAKLSRKLSLEILALYNNNNTIPNDALTYFVKKIMLFKPIRDIFPLDGQYNNGIDMLRYAVAYKIENFLATTLFKLNNTLFNKYAKVSELILPTMSADELRRYVVAKFFTIEAVRQLNRSFEKHLKPIADEVDKVVLELNSGVNRTIKQTLANASNVLNKKLQSIHENFVGKFLNKVPLHSFGIDGYALIHRDYIQRIHIDGDFTLIGSKKDTTFSFLAALDMWRNSAKSSGGCYGNDFTGTYNVQISSRDITIPIGKMSLKVDTILAGVTLMPTGLPVGVFGAINSRSGFQFNKFKLYNIGFGVGIGKYESYLGAKAKAKVETTLLGVDNLIGKICNKDIQATFIPEAVYEFIQLPNDTFFGALVFGEAQIPVWNNGCMLTVVARAKAGSWLLFGGNTPKLGAILGGAAFGKGVCIATLGGEVLLMAETGLDLSIDSIRFQGNGWGAAGLGLCDDSWDSIEESRADDWCGTGDAQFSARFDKNIQLLKIDFSAVH